MCVTSELVFIVDMANNLHEVSSLMEISKVGSHVPHLPLWRMEGYTALTDEMSVKCVPTSKYPYAYFEIRVGWIH